MNCKKISIVVLLVLLDGCQATAGNVSPVPAYIMVKPGTQLILNKPLVIPANKARVYIQGGNVVHENAVDRYYPNCSLEVRTIQTSPQEIKADSFRIQKVSWDEEASYPKLIYASSRHITRRLVSDDDGPVSHENWVTHFYLQSSKNPDVFRLSCAHWEDPADFRPRHLSISEIQKAVGDYLSFKN